VLVGLAVFVAIYAAFVAGLVISGRRADARALARFIPDCLILVKRLLQDPRVPRSRKFALVALAAYLALPIDLVPDFIPVAGQFDDAIATAVVLRFVLRSTGAFVVQELWPGPAESLAVVLRFSGGAPPSPPAG
jgi:uncharacterized membrane protein YkvA (DUF1232 family)